MLARFEADDQAEAMDEKTVSNAQATALGENVEREYVVCTRQRVSRR